MNIILYCEIDILCLTILTIIFIRERKMDVNPIRHGAFKNVILGTTVICLMDVIWVLTEGKPELRIVNLIACTFYMLFSGITSYFWLNYILVRLGKKYKGNYQLLMYAPLVILSVASLLSPFIGSIFTITSAGNYVRGPVFFIQPAVCIFYLLLTTIIVYVQRTKIITPQSRNDYFYLLTFSYLPLVAIIGQIFAYNIPMVWPAFTLSILNIYVNSQNQQISTDSLTGLNNRRQFDYYLKSVVAGHNSKWFLILMDINNFKSINDVYGHLEGDNALRIVGHILKKTCGRFGVFLCRYGGDEFAILMAPNKEYSPDDLIDLLNEELTLFNKQHMDSYQIAISYGISEYDASSTTPIESFIKQADAEMYRDKKRNQIN